MRNTRHLPADCPCPMCRVEALRNTWREDEINEGAAEARAELVLEAAEPGEC